MYENFAKEMKKNNQSRFRRHLNALIWKSYLQRQRRWRLLLLEIILACILFVIMIFIAKPVFLTPIQTESVPPRTAAQILASFTSKNILGYAPNIPPFVSIMARAGDLLKNLQIDNMLIAKTEEELNNILYNRSRGSPIKNPVIWNKNVWKFRIRSSEKAKHQYNSQLDAQTNLHLRTGCLSVQLAVSQAILEHTSASSPRYNLSLVSMPVTPLMQSVQVRGSALIIFVLLTLSLIAPVIETQTLMMNETKLKRALRMRNVDFSTMYLGWVVYAYMTAVPICLLASFMLILIFRWIHIMFALVILLAYMSNMILIAIIVSMFHTNHKIAAYWSIGFTFLSTFLAELLMVNDYDMHHEVITFLLHTLLPPLGLVHALNQFALLQTGRALGASKYSLFYTMLSWAIMSCVYFGVLMLLQRTLSKTAIGGQVSWKSLLFKKISDTNKLNRIIQPKANEIAKLQEVDDLVAKAISFCNVSKNLMNITVLKDVYLDIYRGEFTMLYSERVQEQMIITIEDLLTGLTHQDEGTINVLGHILTPQTYSLAMPQMIGYCHRSDVLIDDLTVEEHIIFYTDICLWIEPRQYLDEFVQIRSHRLKVECALESVWCEKIRNLGFYYRAQLCWAIALLIEPRIIFIPNFTDNPTYVRVIKDKIMQYKKHLTIVLMCCTSIQLEHADRVFVFDNHVLVFGGTPAYMFFKYGREYRVRVTFSHGGGDTNTEYNITELLDRASAAGATVRAHLGSLLILRLPSSPSEKVAGFVKELDDRRDEFGITSLSISIPDSEEVSRRAIYGSRAAAHEISIFQHNKSREAMLRITEPLPWTRSESWLITCAQIKTIIWKFKSFYFSNKLLILITISSAILAGTFMGFSFTNILEHIVRTAHEEMVLTRAGEVLTVEAFPQSSTLVLRSDFSEDSTSVANAYVLSETGATAKEISVIDYTALSHTESLTEYLVTRAIDSPQDYVYKYAYGIDVASDRMGNLIVQAIYSPMHQDKAAAARSIARVFMALLRHYTGNLEASIQVVDEPLILDQGVTNSSIIKLPPWIKFVLIMTISNIILIPSKEYGIVRHTQCQASNFSPMRYWFSLYFCNMMVYWMLVAIMTVAMNFTIYFSVAVGQLDYVDLVAVPVVLTIYDITCIPVAYLFSLRQGPALNTMSFVMINFATGFSQVLREDPLPFKIWEMLFYVNVYYAKRVSPQWNMERALVKINTIFLYNTECIIYERKNVCSSTTFHKCCEKCGVLEACFQRKSYFTWDDGILTEVSCLLGTAIAFMVLLLLWEHRVIQRCWRHIISWFVLSGTPQDTELTAGAKREVNDVLDKFAQIKFKRNEKIVTYGERLLAVNVTRKTQGMFSLRNVYLGLGKGELLALSGLKRHGRLKLAEIMAGYKVPHAGEIYCMSKWKLKDQPFLYSRNISLCCEVNPLPTWMSVYDALFMLAVLRGVPKKYVGQEVRNYIEALELFDQINTKICDLLPNDKARVHFAAAVIAAPPVLILDEFTEHQKYSVRRAMYHILDALKKKGHGIFISSAKVERNLPITNRLAILVDGSIYDIDYIDALIERYSQKGYTVVVHLKDEIDVTSIFSRYFKAFDINDVSEVLVNIQVYDALRWPVIFEKMELLKAENPQIYSYIVSVIPIDYVYNSILSNERGLRATNNPFMLFYFKNIFGQAPLKKPTQEVMNRLTPFEKKYDIVKLKELPWSVIFHNM